MWSAEFQQTVKQLKLPRTVLRDVVGERFTFCMALLRLKVAALLWVVRPVTGGELADGVEADTRLVEQILRQRRVDSVLIAVRVAHACVRRAPARDRGHASLRGLHLGVGRE